jgi:hypothetical protein
MFFCLMRNMIFKPFLYNSSSEIHARVKLVYKTKQSVLGFIIFSLKQQRTKRYLTNDIFDLSKDP